MLSWCCVQVFYSFFGTLKGKEVTVELKNDLNITGNLHSIDQVLSGVPPIAYSTHYQ